MPGQVFLLYSFLILRGRQEGIQFTEGEKWGCEEWEDSAWLTTLYTIELGLEPHLLNLNPLWIQDKLSFQATEPWKNTVHLLCCYCWLPQSNVRSSIEHSASPGMPWFVQDSFREKFLPSPLTSTSVAWYLILAFEISNVILFSMLIQQSFKWREGRGSWRG